LQASWRRLLHYDIISALNCFCGGLFLGICLLELLPESEEGVAKVLASAMIHTRFPVAHVMVGAGLLLVLFIEHAVTATLTRPRTKHVERIGDGRSAPLACADAPGHSKRRTNSSLSTSSENMLRPSQGGDAQAASEWARILVLIGMLSIHSIFEGLALGLEVTVAALIELLVAVTVHKCVLAFGLGLRLFETLSSTLAAAACGFVFCTASPLGCAVGIIVSSETELSTNSTMTPLFTQPADHYFGSSLSKVSGTLIASAVLECLATGTFLYVTFVEVIPSEFSHASSDESHEHAEEALVSHSSQARKHSRRRKKPISKFLKNALLLVGFGAVIGLQFL